MQKYFYRLSICNGNTKDALNKGHTYVNWVVIVFFINCQNWIYREKYATLDSELYVVFDVYNMNISGGQWHTNKTKQITLTSSNPRTCIHVIFSEKMFIFMEFLHWYGFGMVPGLNLYIYFSQKYARDA